MPRKGGSLFLPAGVVSFLLSAPVECYVEPIDSLLQLSSGESDLIPERKELKMKIEKSEIFIAVHVTAPFVYELN